MNLLLTMNLFAEGDSILDTALKLRARDEEEWIILHRFLAKRKQKRREKYQYDRIDWEKSLREGRYTGEFQKRYRMTEATFDKLVEILRPALSVDEKMSRNSTGGNSPITPVMVVAIGLRYLAGEKAVSLANVFGISRSSVYRVKTKFLDAVSQSKDLRIENARVSFNQRSSST